MKYSFLLAFILSSSAYAQVCVGPAPCDYEPMLEPVGPTELCLPEGCAPVTYYWLDRFMVATSFLPNGYPMLGWSGPCLQEFCPDVRNQAYSDLELNAKRANRAQRFEQ